jgi:hypothetical protein
VDLDAPANAIAAVVGWVVAETVLVLDKLVVAARVLDPVLDAHLKEDSVSVGFSRWVFEVGFWMAD